MEGVTCTSGTSSHVVLESTNTTKEMYYAISGSSTAGSLTINVSYKLNLVPSVLAIAPYVGPTFAYGLSSKGSVAVGSTTTTSDHYDGTTYGKFDLQVGVGLAFDIVEMVRVSVGYNFGLLDRDSDEDTKVTTSNLNFGVAYLF